MNNIGIKTEDFNIYLDEDLESIINKIGRENLQVLRNYEFIVYQTRVITYKFSRGTNKLYAVSVPENKFKGVSKDIGLKGERFIGIENKSQYGFFTDETELNINNSNLFKIKNGYQIVYELDGNINFIKRKTKEKTLYILTKGRG